MDLNMQQMDDEVDIVMNECMAEAMDTNAYDTNYDY